jgi:hypothetical protein
MTHATLPNKKILDWYDFEPLREEVFAIRRCRESEDKRISNICDMLLPELGQVLDLRVKVTDPDMAQVVLISMYGEGQCLIPGMELQRIAMDAGTDTRNTAAATLRDLADRIERGELVDQSLDGGQ